MLRYLKSHPFVRPAGVKVSSSFLFPRKVTTVPELRSFTKLGNSVADTGITTSSLGPIGIKPYCWPSQPTWTRVRSPLFSDRIKMPFLCRVGPLILSPMP